MLTMLAEVDVQSVGSVIQVERIVQMASDMFYNDQVSFLRRFMGFIHLFFFLYICPFRENGSNIVYLYCTKEIFVQ